MKRFDSVYPHAEKLLLKSSVASGSGCETQTACAYQSNDDVKRKAGDRYVQGAGRYHHTWSG